MADHDGGFEVSGFLAGLSGFGKLMLTANAEAAEEVAEYILAQSMQEVPHETGDLQASGRVSVDRDRGVAAVSYDTPYAVVQHEDMTFHHDAGRKAKYLEDPIAAASQGPAQEIYKKRLGKYFKEG